MENTTSEKESAMNATPSKTGFFSRFFLAAHERFGLQKWGFIPIIIVSVLVISWVYQRGNRAYEGAIMNRPLRVGIVSWPGYACGLVANNGLHANKDSEFWNKYKLLVEFEILEDESKLRDKFERGELDIIWSTVDSLAQQAPEFEKKGIHPRAFMLVDWSHGGDAIVASAGINKIEDLEGKIVAAPQSASQWLLEYSLENSSLTDAQKAAIRQARKTAAGSQQAAEWFLENKVDAAVLWEPDVTKVLNAPGRSSKILIDTKTAANLIADVMIAKQEFIQQNPRVIDAFIKGWLIDGSRKAASDPRLAVKVLLEEPKFAALGEEMTQKLLGKTVWATLEDNAKMFGLSGSKVFFDDLFNWASRLWAKYYRIDPIKAEQARDVSRLQEIYNSQKPEQKLGCITETPVATIQLTVPFATGKAELDAEAQSILNNQDALFTLQTHTGALFCVQSCSDT